MNYQGPRPIQDHPVTVEGVAEAVVVDLVEGEEETQVAVIKVEEEDLPGVTQT